VVPQSSSRPASLLLLLKRKKEEEVEEYEIKREFQRNNIFIRRENKRWWVGWEEAGGWEYIER
jgi:hypothetical protein